MPTTAADLMTRSVVSVDADTPLIEVYRLFVGEGIHGAPVVDDEERVVGVVSSTDLIRAVAEERDTAASSAEYLRDLVEFSGPDWGRGLADFQDRLGQLTVADVMSESPLTVETTTPVRDVARQLRERGVHRAWVQQSGRLCGVISTFDLLPLIERIG